MFNLLSTHYSQNVNTNACDVIAVRILPTTTTFPPSMFWVLAASPPFWAPIRIFRKASEEGLSAWTLTATQLEDPSVVIIFWLQLGLPLIFVFIWGVNQRLEEPSLSLPLSSLLQKFSFQLNKIYT